MSRVAKMYGAAVVVLLAMIAVPTQAHPGYARNKTLLCTTMEPGHQTAAQADSTFKDHYSMVGASENGIYSVRIDALKEDFGIQGYMIEARDDCTGELLGGNWNTAQADQIMSCGPTPNTGLNTVHHRPKRSNAVPQVKHAWVPLNDSNVTSLKFLATVVNKKDTYWVRQSVTVVPCNKN